MATSRYRFLAVPAAVILLSPLVSGCSKDAAPNAVQTTPMTQQAADDLAAHFAAEVSKGGAPVARAGASSLQDLAAGRIAMPRGAAPLRVQDEVGFSWSFSVRFFAEGGEEQPTFEPGVTATMELVARAHGNVQTAKHQATVGIFRALTIDGLLPDETTLELDGAANDTADCSFAAVGDKPAREYHLLAGGSLTDVMTLKDTSVNPYPLSGTLRWQVQADAAEGEKEAHYRATVVVTYNGTRYPSIEVDEHFEYNFDLETGEITRKPA